MANYVIDEMPTRTEVESASSERIVEWQLFLRPTMMNEELDIVKAIAQRYDRMSSRQREGLAAMLRKRHSR